MTKESKKRKKMRVSKKYLAPLDLFVSLLETEIKYPILQGGIFAFLDTLMKRLSNLFFNVFRALALWVFTVFTEICMISAISRLFFPSIWKYTTFLCSSGNFSISCATIRCTSSSSTVSSKPPFFFHLQILLNIFFLDPFTFQVVETAVTNHLIKKHFQV